MGRLNDTSKYPIKEAAAEGDTLIGTDHETGKTVQFNVTVTGGDGADGLSAYEVAVANGFVGTEAQWLASLQGADGADGADGATGATGAAGADGADGLSAYEVAVNNGFIGTEAQWLASLQGADGANGVDGADGTDITGAEIVSAIDVELGQTDWKTGGTPNTTVERVLINASTTLLEADINEFKQFVIPFGTGNVTLTIPTTTLAANEIKYIFILNEGNDNVTVESGAGVTFTNITFTDIKNITLYSRVQNDWDIKPIDNQVASEVAFTPYLTIGSTDLQAALQELKDEVDALPNSSGVPSVTYDTQTVGLIKHPDNVGAGLEMGDFITGYTSGTTLVRIGQYLGGTQNLANIDIIDSVDLSLYPVPIPVTSVLVSPSTLTVTEGDPTQQLSVAFTPANATDQTGTWSTSDALVATVDSSGLVTVVGAGTATITFTSTDGGFTSNCAVTVNAASSELLLNTTFDDATNLTTDAFNTWTIAGGVATWNNTRDNEDLVFATNTITAGNYTFTFTIPSGNPRFELFVGATQVVGDTFTGTGTNLTLSFNYAGADVNTFTIRGRSGAGGTAYDIDNVSLTLD